MDADLAELQLEGLSEEEIRKILDARAEKSSEDVQLSPEDYDIYIEKQNQIIDSINALRVTLLTVMGNKPKDAERKPVQRPKTQYETLLEKKILEFEKEDNSQLASEFGF